MIREMQMKSTIRSEQASSKCLQTTNAEEEVEKKEPSYTVGEIINWYNHYEE